MQEKHSIKCEKCKEPVLTWFGNAKLIFGPQFDLKCTKCGNLHKGNIHGMD
jgi:hypothetical protein